MWCLCVCVVVCECVSVLMWCLFNNLVSRPVDWREHWRERDKRQRETEYYDK